MTKRFVINTPALQGAQYYTVAYLLPIFLCCNPAAPCAKKGFKEDLASKGPNQRLGAMSNGCLIRAETNINASKAAMQSIGPAVKVPETS